MNQYVKKIFAAIIAVLFLTGSFISVTAVSRVPSNDSDTRVKIAFEEFYKQEKNSLDVVLIGSSAIYRYYMAVENWDKFGFTSYSLSTMSQPLSAAKYLIEETRKTQNPSLFVIEMRQLVNDIICEKENTEQNKSAYTSTNRFLANCMPFSYNRYLLIKEILADDTLYSNLDFIRNHLKWSTMPISVFCDRLFYESSYEDYISTKCANAITLCTSFDKQEWTTDEHYDLPPEALAVLDDLLSYIQQNDINVLFVSTPYNQEEKNKIAENSIEKYLNDKGYDYLNCNNYYDDLKLDFASDFYNAKHTNIFGALKVTEFIGEYINNNYSLEKNYTQNVVDDWNESITAWEKERDKFCTQAENNVKEAKNEINN